MVTLEMLAPIWVMEERGLYNEHKEMDVPDIMMSFTVPVSWLAAWIGMEWDMSYDEFLDEWTWDDAESIYNAAVNDRKIIREEIYQ